MIKRDIFVEHQIFSVQEDSLEKFIEFDSKIWTENLKKSKGFIEKELWVTKEYPVKVQIITYWGTLDDFVNVDRSNFENLDREFTQNVGKENFKFIKALHLEEKYYKIEK